MSRVKEMWQARIEQLGREVGPSDMDPSDAPFVEFVYGQKVRLLAPFYAGQIGQVVDYLPGSAGGRPTFTVAIPHALSSDEWKGVLCYPEELLAYGAGVGEEQ